MTPSPTPRLGLLFWFHDRPHIARQRVQHLRRLHPDRAIHGLFGGPGREAVRHEEQVPELSTFYLSRTPEDSYWRWRNGDLVVLDWFVHQGRHLDGWDHIAVIHWDLLLLRPLGILFPNLSSEAAFFCGLAELDSTFEREWKWTSPRDPERVSFERFRSYLRDTLGYHGTLYRSLFAFAILPRPFLDDFAALDHPEFGFSEYKLPALAEALGYTLIQKDLGTCWPHLGPHEVGPINGEKVEIGEDYIVQEARRFSVFHPYYQPISPRVERLVCIPK